MARPKKLYGGQPGTTDTTVYTVTAPVIFTQIKEIIVTNVTGAQATIDIALVDSGGAVSDANKIVKGAAIAANSFAAFQISQPLDVGGFVSMKQGTASALTVRMAGYEVS